MIKKILYSIFALSLLASCAIDNDIPYPLITASITGFSVEGQRGPESNESSRDAVIDAKARTVTVYVNDSVDVSELKITQLSIDPRDAELIIDSVFCDDADHFPFSHFASLDSIPVSSNTRLNFSKPVNFTLRTYQDYVWKVTVEQIIKRDIDVVGMNRYVVDPQTLNVIIYVDPSKVPDLSNVQIKTLNLGGEYGDVKPDPTTVHDFTHSQEFNVRLNWEPERQYKTWQVFVYHEESDGGSSSSSSETFAMVSRAFVSGSCTSGSSVEVEYKEQSASDWQKVADVSVSGATYTAEITGLKGSTAYDYRVNIDGATGSLKSFTTAQTIALENGSLDNWHQDGTEWIPNAEGSDFWGTGNKASTIVASLGNLTERTDDAVSGKAARMESKDAMLKLGAGNMFTGDFAIDGLDGILHFGRPFTSFPTSLRLYYKYTSATMQVCGTTELPSNLESLVGRPDSCHIYIALSDKSEPYEIRTKAEKRQLFDKNDANIIAYGEYISHVNQTTYRQIDIPLTYRAHRTPKYIIIVCAASKYGDYYLGGVGSTLFIDEMELVYE